MKNVERKLHHAYFRTPNTEQPNTMNKKQILPNKKKIIIASNNFIASGASWCSGLTRATLLATTPRDRGSHPREVKKKKKKISKE